MQSGLARTKEWVLDFEPEEPREVEALMGAAANGNRTLVETLLRKKANREAFDEDGRTALTYAMKNGHAAVAKLLEP